MTSPVNPSFVPYQRRRSDETLRAQRAALIVFGDFLTEHGVAKDGRELLHYPDRWSGITWHLVQSFVDWMDESGYAIGTINHRLSVVRTYAALATKAGVLTPDQLTLIQEVKHYSRKEGIAIDARRHVSRVGAKKAEAIFLAPEHVALLKKQPNTSQGRRDAVIVAFLVDQGLRVGELARLQVTDVNLEAGTFTLDRKNLYRIQTHELTPDAKQALAAYYDYGDAPAMGALLRASTTTGGVQLTHSGMKQRSISQRVHYLGELIGIDALSPNDLRHTWATLAARAGTSIDRLRDAGGWASPSSPILHLETETIANKGVKLHD